MTKKQIKGKNKVKCVFVTQKKARNEIKEQSVRGQLEDKWQDVKLKLYH